jgi:DnaK suppressor protein
MTPIQFIADYKLLILLIFSFYFIFKLTNYRGMRKERSFDISLIYIVLTVLFLKVVHFFQNYQNYQSLSEIFFNSNIPSESVYLLMIFNIFISILIGKLYKFSPFKLSDIFMYLLLFGVFLFEVKSNESFLLFFYLIGIYYLQKKFISGFTTFLTSFVLTNYLLLYPIIENGLIFYIIVNTITALFIYRRITYMQTHLSQDFINKCKETLLERKEKILNDLKVIDEDVDPDRDIGNAEYIDEVQEDLKIERNYIFKKELEETLDNINRALKRIEDGTYGVDSKSGEPIDKARLELFPESEENVK